MPFLGVLVLLIQVGFAVHAIRNGRELYWVVIIIMFPMIGCLVYFFVAVYPTLGIERHARKLSDGIAKAIDPSRAMRARIDDVAACGSLNNKMLLAEECLNRGFYDDAIKLCAGCMEGAYATDPLLMMRLAHAQFCKGDAVAARENFERLLELQPAYKAGAARLLYARTLESLRENDLALAQYERLAREFAGEEARYRYARLLKQVGQEVEANKVCQEILLNARRAPGYYRREQRTWIDLAKQEMAGTTGK
jgi:hypothetical protein